MPSRSVIRSLIRISPAGRMRMAAMSRGSWYSSNHPCSSATSARVGPYWAILTRDTSQARQVGDDRIGREADQESGQGGHFGDGDADQHAGSIETVGIPFLGGPHQVLVPPGPGVEAQRQRQCRDAGPSVQPPGGAIAPRSTTNSRTMPITASSARIARVMILSRRMRGIGRSIAQGRDMARIAGAQVSSSVCMPGLYGGQPPRGKPRSPSGESVGRYGSCP